MSQNAPRDLVSAVCVYDFAFLYYLLNLSGLNQVQPRFRSLRRMLSAHLSKPCFNSLPR